MTYRDRFIRAHKARGYEIEERGLVVILRYDNYTAIWFFNADGSRDEANPPQWWIDRP